MKPSTRDALTEFPVSILPLIFSGLLGYTLHALLNKETPSGNHDILLAIAVFLTTKLGTMVDWRYGGSKRAAVADPPTTGETL